MKYVFIKLGIILVIALNFQSCGIYSFGGVNIPVEAKTVQVDFFQNLAPLVVPSLSNTFTEALKDKFITQTRLLYVKTDGDLQFSGEIRGYSISPAAVTANEVASLNRVTMQVRVRFVNRYDESQNLDKDFSAHEDFPGQQSIESVQAQLIEQIVATLVDDIFNNSVANW